METWRDVGLAWRDKNLQAGNGHGNDHADVTGRSRLSRGTVTLVSHYVTPVSRHATITYPCQ